MRFITFYIKMFQFIGKKIAGTEEVFSPQKSRQWISASVCTEAAFVNKFTKPGISMDVVNFTDQVFYYYNKK